MPTEDSTTPKRVSRKRHRRHWGPGAFTSLALTCLSTVLGLGLPVFCRLRRVFKTAQRDRHEVTDAILVLGRRLESDAPTDVFIERLKHARQLLDDGISNRIVITGGLTGTALMTEAEAGRRVLLATGVPAEAIFCEDRSRNTLENLFNVRDLAAAKGWKTLTIVSDPLHLARACTLASGLGLDVAGSPASSCPPRKGSLHWWARALKEAFFLHWYAVGMTYSRLLRSERLLKRVT